ncbi:IS3 family transposase [Pectinatus frisingensis]|uniref:IS3 family transposase n=1 Tax=Pectinatus frisingensis TaxID=865 RepID=UPI003D8070F1
MLAAHIQQIGHENEHNYGVQKIYEELNGKEISVGRSRVQRLMHQQGSKAQIKK